MTGTTTTPFPPPDQPRPLGQRHSRTAVAVTLCHDSWLRSARVIRLMHRSETVRSSSREPRRLADMSAVRGRLHPSFLKRRFGARRELCRALISRYVIDPVPRTKRAVPPFCTGTAPSVRSVRGAQNGIFCIVRILWRMRGEVQEAPIATSGHESMGAVCGTTPPTSSGPGY